MRAVNFLWVGPSLGYLEQLCLKSALAAGHECRLFSYDEVSGVPRGVEHRDASEVIPLDRLLSRSGSKWMALASDLWRYELLSKGLGYWCDLDVLFLKPFDFEEPYVLGYQDETIINGAVLYAPADSAFVRDLLDAPKPNTRPAWFGPKRSLAFYRQRLKGRVGLEDMPWGTYGPDLITYMARKHSITPQAKEVFYPIPWQHADILFGPSELVEQFITDETRSVHLWHGRLGDFTGKPPAKGSFIAKMIERFELQDA